MFYANISHGTLNMPRPGIRSNLCSKCVKPKEIASKRYCRDCANAYAREWRKTHPLNEFQKIKANCRSKTKVYVKRDKIKKLPCFVCKTTEKVQAHHSNYNDFKNVQWLCERCHREYHVEQTYEEYKWWRQIKMEL